MSRSYSDHSFQPDIFVNYRRSDSSGESALLAERLIMTYGRRRVFFDVRAIAAGTDYERALEKARLSAKAMLAVIGPDWVSATTEDGRRRLELDDDPVRIEIQAALNKGAAIIPILVKGSSMPPARDLPKTIKEIARIQAHRIDHETFERDFEELKRQLDAILLSRSAGRTSRANGAGHIATGGAVAATDGIYVEREVDFRLLRFIRDEKERVILCGPRHSGKTSLLIRTAEQIRAEGREAVLVDLSMFGLHITFTQFLAGLASEISEQLDVPLVLETFGSQPLQAFIEFLAMIPRRSVLILDEADIMFHYSFFELAADVLADAVSMLSGAGKGCCLILSGTFINGDIPLLDFAGPSEVLLVTNYNAFQSRLFFERAGVSIDDDEFQTLYDLAGGQPYLLAVIAHKVRSGATPDELTKAAADINGPFGMHLRWLSDLLKSQGPLLDSLCQFLNGKRLSDSAADQLLYAGLLKRKRGQLELASGLYKRTLTELCKETRTGIGKRILNRNR